MDISTWTSSRVSAHIALTTNRSARCFEVAILTSRMLTDFMPPVFISVQCSWVAPWSSLLFCDKSSSLKSQRNGAETCPRNLSKLPDCQNSRRIQILTTCLDARQFERKLYKLARQMNKTIDGNRSWMGNRLMPRSRMRFRKALRQTWKELQSSVDGFRNWIASGLTLERFRDSEHSCQFVAAETLALELDSGEHRPMATRLPGSTCEISTRA